MLDEETISRTVQTRQEAGRMSRGRDEDGMKRHEAILQL
jgi:hypothetical protein